jgi:hypothetical protein
MRRRLRDNGLTLAMTGFFLIFLIGQAITGYRTYNQEQREHGETTIAFRPYLSTGHFVEATFENWESEYLQMAFYVCFTAFLYQRGSAESKDPDKREPVDEDPRESRDKPDVPWPVRAGGVALKLYSHSLTLALLALFLLSFGMHAWGGAREYSQGQIAHGGESVTTLQFMETAEFWFQSFQNWQSEFLAVASLAALSIFLRQRGSPESKPVAAPHHQTGG